MKNYTISTDKEKITKNNVHLWVKMTHFKLLKVKVNSKLQ